MLIFFKLVIKFSAFLYFKSLNKKKMNYQINKPIDSIINNFLLKYKIKNIEIVEKTKGNKFIFKNFNLKNKTFTYSYIHLNTRIITAYEVDYILGRL